MAKKTNPNAYGKARFPKGVTPTVTSKQGGSPKGDQTSKGWKIHNDVLSNISKVAGTAASIATVLKIAGVLNDPKWYENYDLLHSYAVNKYIPWTTMGAYANAALTAPSTWITGGIPEISRMVSYELVTLPPRDCTAINIAASELYSKMRASARASTPYTVNDVAKYILYVIAFRIFLNACLKYMRIGHTSIGDDGLYQEYLGQATFAGNSATPHIGIRTNDVRNNSYAQGTILPNDAFRTNYGEYAPEIRAMLKEATTFYNSNLRLDCDLLKKIDVENQYVFLDALSPTGVASTFKNQIVIPNSENDNGTAIPLYTSSADSTYYAFHEPLFRVYNQLIYAWSNGATFGAIAGDIAHALGENYGYKFVVTDTLIETPISGIYDDLFNNMIKNITIPATVGFFDSANNYTLTTVANFANTLLVSGATPFANLTSADWSTVVTGVNGAAIIPVNAGSGSATIAAYAAGATFHNQLMSIAVDKGYSDGELAEILSLRGRYDITQNANTGDYDVFYDHGWQVVLSMDIWGEAYLSPGSINRMTTLCSVSLNTGSVTASNARGINYMSSLYTFIDNAPIAGLGLYMVTSSGAASSVASLNYNVDAMTLLPDQTLSAVTVGASASLARAVK